MANRDKEEPANFRTIDKLKLDEEWIRQPDLYHEYAVKLAEAKLVVEDAKASLDVTRAELGRDIRNDPSDFAIEKITESAISECILLQKVYQADLAALNNAKHRVNILAAAVEALDHRKKALENLVYLHGQDYFATPRAKGTDKEKMEEVEERALRKRGQRKAKRREEDDDD